MKINTLEKLFSVGSGNQIRYSLNDSTNFQIDSDGFIRAVVKFDREKIAQMNISVFAIDNGTPNKNASALVIINIKVYRQF